ncbi:MAG: DNA polymerase I [Acidobacteriota bacterium]
MSVRPDPERTLYLVDGTNNIFRAFYAIRGLTTSRGLPTNAVYGFTTMLRKLLREQRPRYLGVAFDLPEPTFRHEAYAEYKANRPEAPDELVAQIPYVKRVCRVLSVPILELPGYEADDLIATMAERARRGGRGVVIVTTDKDLLQLVGEGVLVYNPAKDLLLDSEGVERAFGVRPEQVCDVLALAGDASDNVPGVPGIGDKGARELIRRFGDLESLLNGAADVTRRAYREGLLAHADAARMSRDLVTVRRDAPLEMGPEDLRLGRPDPVRARELFAELEFGALAREIEVPAESRERPHTVVRDLDALERAVAGLRDGGLCALSLESDDPRPMRASPVGITLAGPGERDLYYVPLRRGGSASGSGLDPAAAMRRVAPLLEGRGFRCVGHDIKSDLILLRRHGVREARFGFDTMLASYVLDPSGRAHALEAVAREIAALTVPSYEAILGTGAKAVSMAEVGVERVAPVACARAAALLPLEERLRTDLERQGLLPLLIDLEMPLAEVLAAMEGTGVRIDSEFLRDLSARWESELRRLTGAIHELAGEEFNINSPRQLGRVLFSTLGLRPGRKTQKTRTFSTGVEVLEELARSHELPRRVLEYRSLQKLKSTYVDALPLLVNRETGRVHTSFNQAVAATGRLSSSDPNLQNIPIRTDLGRRIRRAFVPAEGCLLLCGDYSQIELRVLAHLSGDPGLIAAFREGEDVHRRTAAELFGVHPQLVSDEMRRRAKAVNFGIIYGMGPQRLSREQGVSVREAGRFIEEYLRRFPKVKEYVEAVAAEAESEGRVRTLLGRVRHLPEIRGADRNARQQALRAAVNTTVQGTAADLIKRAMVVLHERLMESGSGARMTLQVHDELLLEVPEAELDPTASLLRLTMESVERLAVPLIADLRVGRNWLDMEARSRSGN